MRRVVVPEMLDEDLGTPQEVRESLADLRGINRNFGGFNSVASLLRGVVARTGRRHLSFLDVAGGTGDVAENARVVLGRDGIELRCTVLDRAPTHMSFATPTASNVAGDALALPFSDASFDVVGCNLFCHHLEPDELLTFFNEALRVARVAVIASDLRRSWLHLLAAYAGRPIFSSPLTRNDAPISIRRAYTLREIREIAERTNAQVDLQTHLFQRFGLTLWKAPEQ